MRSHSSHVSIPIPDANGGNCVHSVTKFRYFTCKKEVYIWDSENRYFFLLRGLDHEMPCQQFYEQVGLSEKDQALRQLVYGPNDIIVPNHSIGLYYLPMVSTLAILSRRMKGQTDVHIEVVT